MITRLAGVIATHLHPARMWPTPEDYRLADDVLRAIREPTQDMLGEGTLHQRDKVEAVWMIMVDRARHEGTTE